MEADLRLMEDFINQIEKGRKNFKKTPKERITETYVAARLESLEGTMLKFTLKHENIIYEYKKEQLEESSYVKNDVFNMGYEMYLTYKSELKTMLNSIVQPVEPSVSTGRESSQRNKDSIVRLPKISIPVFGGDYAEWTSFKDLFTSLIHNNTTLDDVQRLHYLKTQVKGEAEQLIKQIPVTQDNYLKCWELLKNRYNNKRYMSNCILKRLFAQRTMSVESPSALKDLLDTTTDCMHELSNLGIQVESWDVIIIHIVSLKLDNETRKQWELYVNSLSVELPKFHNFGQFLEERFRALEFVESSKCKGKPVKQSTYQLNSLHIASKTICPHCAENHKLYSCSKFAKQDLVSRQSIVKTLGLCYNCLGSNHTSKICRVPITCRICKRRHHTLLHGRLGSNAGTISLTESVVEQDRESSSKTNETIKNKNIVSHFVTDRIQSQTLLATALVQAEARNGSFQILRALLDQGSQASFISEAAVQYLRLNKTASKICISGLGGGQSGLTSKYVVMVNMQSLHDPSFRIRVKAHVLQKVTSVLPERKFYLPKWEELDEIRLSDPEYNSPNKIDILLGAEVYGKILKKGLKKHPTETMIAQDTYLGWVLSGLVSETAVNERKCHNVIINMHVQLDEQNLLKRFWEIESEPYLECERVLTPEEQECENHFAATKSRDENGRYVVELPFRSKRNYENGYGDTRAIAVKRLLSMERRLAKDVELKNEYTEVLKEYISLGHMEEVKDDIEEKRERVWLPHHAVLRPDKSTTKTRVVFNASDRGTNGVSLNDTLMVGPTLQPALRHIIMRWRKHPICLTADIIKMYRQVKIAKKHLDYQRIVWRNEKDLQIKDYRLLRVTFGTSCAPYLAVKAMQQVAIDEGHNFPLAADRVRKDFYMDDLMTGCQSESEAIQVYEEMNELMKRGGFTLQKWSSNKKGLLKKEQEDNGRDMTIKEDDVIKILGLTWNRFTDEFEYTVKLESKEAPETKRGIIAEICRLYDPLGWIAPCIITAKIFIQKMWLTGLDWDDRLPIELLNEWKQYREELGKCVKYHLPRWIQTSDSDSIVELHGFGDASNAAYAAAVYIRCVKLDGRVETRLIAAKTKVAPIKQLSIPKLELCGAVLVTKLLVEVAKVLKIQKSKLHAWTDSTVVLAWLSDHPSRWKTFVANRTSEILTHLDSSQWSYVNTKDNPADYASRGMRPTALLDDLLWQCGPSWLGKDLITYEKPAPICTKTELEVRAIKTHAATLMNQSTDLSTRFSSLTKFIRVIAFCRRFCRMKSSKINLKYSLYLTAKEIQESLDCCIRHHQSHAFTLEIMSLAKTGMVSQKSKLSMLNPFLDKLGIMRVGGRMERANLSETRKHPIIIDGGSHLAKLIVADAHLKTMHGGQQLTCNYIRNSYWVTRLKNQVKSYIHHCVPCIRNAATFRTPLMGQLPSCRVTPSKPFSNAGVDYAGPINIRVSKGRGQRSYKGYICLFICMATRAVHIEAVSDLTTEGFLAAFRRFVARRGRCNHIWSDNGTNFVGASRELKKLFASEQATLVSDIASVLANNGTEWHFIPPHAPNFGGLWEAGIKSIKYHLRRVIGDSTLTYEELATVLAQIEACLNSRPLSRDSSDSDDCVPLTPGHFLVNEPLIVAPDHELEHNLISNLRRWQLTQRMVQVFWKRWSQEYLTQFFQRYKWNTKTPELKRGDVVLVKDENLPPAKWLYGWVVDLHPGSDNVTRVVTLRYKNSFIQRPTSKLCLLPIDDNNV